MQIKKKKEERVKTKKGGGHKRKTLTDHRIPQRKRPAQTKKRKSERKEKPENGGMKSQGHFRKARWPARLENRRSVKIGREAEDLNIRTLKSGRV